MQKIHLGVSWYSLVLFWQWTDKCSNPRLRKAMYQGLRPLEIWAWVTPTRLAMQTRCGSQGERESRGNLAEVGGNDSGVTPRTTTATKATVCHTNFPLLSFSQEKSPWNLEGAAPTNVSRSQREIKGKLWWKLRCAAQISLRNKKLITPNAGSTKEAAFSCQILS